MQGLRMHFTSVLGLLVGSNTQKKVELLAYALFKLSNFLVRYESKWWLLFVRLMIRNQDIHQARPLLISCLPLHPSIRFHDGQGHTMWSNLWLGWKDEGQGRDKVEKQEMANNEGNGLKHRSHTADRNPASSPGMQRLSWLPTQCPLLIVEPLSPPPRCPLVPLLESAFAVPLPPTKMPPE